MTKKTKILFLHPNFPGQFKQLTIYLGKQEKYDVKFLCMTNYGNYIKGVQPLVIKGERSQASMDSNTQNELDKMLFRAESYRKAFVMLCRKNWNPDIIIGHTGWGCGVHAKEIWTKAKFIGYAEWWFEAFTQLKKEMSSNKYLGITQSGQAKLWHRNKLIGFELCTADKIVAPSEWQKKQLPTGLQARCVVVPDGIDTKYFSNTESQLNEKPLITYGTRGMEPMRCFAEFIKSLPFILEKNPELEVEIAGEDKICYGGINPAKDISWGMWARKYLASGNFDKRVKWLGHLSYDKYRDWLQRSWCHVYLSQPFVCSWSLLDAIACGNLVVASKTSPVEEYCQGLIGVSLVSNSDYNTIADNVMHALNNAKKYNKLVLQDARQDLLSRLSLEQSIKSWLRVAGLDPNTLH